MSETPPVPLKLVARQHQADVIEVLEMTLELAKRGEVKAVLILSDNGSSVDYARGGNLGVGAMMWAFERFVHGVHAELDQDETPPPPR